MAKSTTQKSVQLRPPVVAILGHVDHGKTTLLDYIRHTRRAAKEVGGITQSIGAYQANFQGKKITFIDTPGHAAFSKMRSRGASVADIAVLVVASSEGVKPQTVESIKHIQAAKIPMLVALTKMDLEGASPDSVKAQLTEHQVFVEGYGGNTPIVELSAKSGKGVDNLLENILLLSELEELEANPDLPLEAVVIEAALDAKRGNLVSAIVYQGKISVGDNLFTPTSTARVRALLTDTLSGTKEALPGDPIQILGFKNLPEVGETIKHSLSGQVPRETAPSETPTPPTPDSPSEDKSKKLSIILRADTIGSLEAIKNSLSSEINLVHAATGDVSESDILLATATKSTIINFNVKVPPSVKRLAESDGVVVKSYRIIYELLDYLEKKVLRLMEPTIDEDELGRSTILKTFDFKDFVVLGAKVESGRLEIGDTVHLVRNDEILKNARIKSLKIGKEDVKKVPAGSECGIVLNPSLDTRSKDVILAYRKKLED